MCATMSSSNSSWIPTSCLCKSLSLLGTHSSIELTCLKMAPGGWENLAHALWVAGKRGAQGGVGQDLVLKGWSESVVEHLLVEDRGDAA